MNASPVTPRVVLVGVPANRRVVMFQEALASFGLPPAVVVSWLDVANRHLRWEEVLAFGNVLRLESPGEDFEVERALLVLGAEEEDAEESAARLSRAQTLTLKADFGSVRFLRQWYLGFRRVLCDLKAVLAASPSKALMQTPDGIALMFDKVRCQSRLSKSNFPTPRTLGRIRSFDELVAEMDRLSIHRVFIKPAHGSSATGVIALERSGRRMQAFSSSELVRDGEALRIYNSLRVRKYTKLGDIAALVDAIAPERVQVEVWVPKAGLDGRRIDLRMLVVDGRAQHAVVRNSCGPMTNLHLGNTRGELRRLIERMGEPAWADLRDTCERAQSLCEGSLYAGWDVVIGTDFRKHWLLEVNAFGDLLPRVLHDGKTTYQAEIEALLCKAGHALGV